MDTKQLLEAVEIIKVVKLVLETSQNEWLPVIAAVAGAFVGGVSTYLPNLLIEQRRRRDERHRVESALLAEVRAILSIVEHRNYIEELGRVVDDLRNAPGTTCKFQVRVPDHYSRVYQAHIASLGIIDSHLGTKIIEFHQLLDAIVQDITPGGSIADEGGDVEAFEQLVMIAKTAVAIGRRISQP